MAITRHIDVLGRVVIPAEMRHGLHIKPGDELSIDTDGAGSIVITRAEAHCAICGSDEHDTRLIRGRGVCSECISRVKAL